MTGKEILGYLIRAFVLFAVAVSLVFFGTEQYLDYLEKYYLPVSIAALILSLWAVKILGEFNHRFFKNDKL